MWWMLLVACGGDAEKPDGDTDDTSVVDTDDPGPTGITVPEPTGDPATVPLAGDCATEVAFGEFLVEVQADYSLVDGSMRDGIVPLELLEEVGAEGDCRLLRRNLPFCDPGCQGGETCDWDGSCIPFPVGQDIGVVTIGGLESDVILEAVVPGFSYFDVQVPHPVFAPGSLIELRTWDSPLGDVELHGVGFEPLALTGDEVWTLFTNQDLAVTWTPTPEDRRTTVHLSMSIDQHGSTPVQLVCEWPDTGSATVPAALIDGMVGFGVTGFPMATVSRRTLDSVDYGGGCLALRVSSPTSPEVRVDGFIPCATDLDCPQGLTCDPVDFICQ